MPLRRRSQPPGRRAGDPHHRAFVGPPEDYDRIGGLQLALLVALGLRHWHRVADLGCGSLRAGRFLIPYLDAGCYYGLEPSAQLVDAGIRHEVGRDLVRTRRPSFDHRDDFDLSCFGTTFDIVLAQSIFSHTHADLLATALERIVPVLGHDGILVATYVHESQAGSDFPCGPDGSGWLYPKGVRYEWAEIVDATARVGLDAAELAWPHPRQRWFVAAMMDAVDVREITRTIALAPPGAWLRAETG